MSYLMIIIHRRLLFFTFHLYLKHVKEIAINQFIQFLSCVCPSVRLSVRPSVRPSFRLSICLTVGRSVGRSVSSVGQSVLSIGRSVCPSVCLSNACFRWITRLCCYIGLRCTRIMHVIFIEHWGEGGGS